MHQGTLDRCEPNETVRILICHCGLVHCRDACPRCGRCWSIIVLATYMERDGIPREPDDDPRMDIRGGVA